MPIVRSALAPTVPTYDSWGNILRADWEPYGSGLWHIKGETQRPGEGAVDPSDPALLSGYTGGAGLISQALADPAFRSGARSYSAGAPGAQSVNAYNASLQSQGISPSELPYGSSGQISTARALAAHNQQAPGYLKSYFSAHQDDLIKALQDEAARRGVTVQALAQALGYI